MVATPTILVCDDDGDARSLIVSTVAALGYHVIEAVDGIEALEKCAIQLPDLILLDIMMPRMDGMEFLREFRAKVQSPYIPVLMLTALDHIESRVEGLSGGADDYVTKPFQYRELQARIQALLRTRELTEALRSRTQELEEANNEVRRTQEQLLLKERELTATRISGTAAHNLGQPLTTILLNLFVLEKSITQASLENVPGLKEAVSSIKAEANEMREILGQLQTVDPARTKDYVGDVKILDLQKSSDNES